MLLQTQSSWKLLYTGILSPLFLAYYFLNIISMGWSTYASLYRKLIQQIYPCLLQQGFHSGSSSLVRLSLARIRSSIQSYQALYNISYQVGWSSRLTSSMRNLLQFNYYQIKFESLNQLFVNQFMLQYVPIMMMHNKPQSYIIIGVVIQQQMKGQLTQNIYVIKHVILKNISLFGCSQLKQSEVVFRQQCQQKEIIQIQQTQSNAKCGFVRLHADLNHQIRMVIDIKQLSGGIINYVYLICAKFSNYCNQSKAGQDKCYVIKIQKLIQDLTDHQIQLMKLAQEANAKVPILLDFGQFHFNNMPHFNKGPTDKTKKYILMSYIPGDKLWRYWPKLTQHHKQKAIEQICAQMKKLNSIKFSQYSTRRPYKFKSMKQSIIWYNLQNIKQVRQSKEFKSNRLTPQTMNNFAYLEQYLRDNVSVFERRTSTTNMTNMQQKESVEFKQQQTGKENHGMGNEPVFVHNDLHFGNIMYDVQKHEVTGIIDFDFVRQLNVDFQLRQILDFLDNPPKYVQKQYLPSWLQLYGLTNKQGSTISCSINAQLPAESNNVKASFHLSQGMNKHEANLEIKYLQKMESQVSKYLKHFKYYYPELFADPHKNMVTRLRIYLMDQMMMALTGDNEDKQQKFNERMNIYYHSDHLERYFYQF